MGELLSSEPGVRLGFFVSVLVWLDRLLRCFVVTPEMHRVHHSVIVPETNSNFGFNLPWWDFLLGTYQDQPAEGHTGMAIGLSQFRAACPPDTSPTPFLTAWSKPPMKTHQFASGLPL